MTGFDRDSDFGSNTFGSWFDPDWMYYMSFDDLKAKVLKNTKHVMPCYCAICKKIKDLSTVSKDDWYNYRREHYVLTMNEYMRQISQSIQDRTIELAREKLVNSQLSLLQGLIPRQ
jgi:queuine/archaeosine tRNA-ribosyltransferase